MSFSICVPVYNQERYISDLIKSIKDQKKKNPNINFEIIFSDNKSTDKTTYIIKKNINNYIKLYNNKTNIGFCKNLIKILGKAKSNYITFMGADDILYSLSNLNNLINFQKKNNVGICFSPIFLFNKNKNRKIKVFDSKKKIFKESDDAICNSWLNSGLASLGGWVINKRFITKNQLNKIPKKSIFPEFYIGFYLIKNMSKVAQYDKVFYLQRNRNDVKQLANKQYTDFYYYKDLYKLIQIEKNQKIKKKLNKQFSNILISNLFSLKVFGSSFFSIISFIFIKKIYKNFKIYDYFYFTLVLIMPKFILRQLLLIFRLIKYNRS